MVEQLGGAFVAALIGALLGGAQAHSKLENRMTALEVKMELVLKLLEKGDRL